MSKHKLTMSLNKFLCDIYDSPNDLIVREYINGFKLSVTDYLKTMPNPVLQSFIDKLPTNVTSINVAHENDTFEEAQEAFDNFSHYMLSRRFEPLFYDMFLSIFC